jgi:hypothetical protein
VEGRTPGKIEAAGGRDEEKAGLHGWQEGALRGGRTAADPDRQRVGRHLTNEKENEERERDGQVREPSVPLSTA